MTPTFHATEVRGALCSLDLAPNTHSDEHRKSVVPLTQETGLEFEPLLFHMLHIAYSMVHSTS